MDEHNELLINLWHQYRNVPATNLSPLLYGEKQQNSLLYVGLNPSFSQRGFDSFLQGTQYEYILENLDDFYSFDNIEERENDYIIIDQLAEAAHQYFKKFDGLADEINLHWEHIDLLYIRNTSQEEVKQLQKNYPEFVDTQINNTLNLIPVLNPKVIIIQNAFACRILSNNLNFEWDDTWGTYKYQNTIPVFLSGMFTGGHALDNGSYERLKWHLNYTYNLAYNE